MQTREQEIENLKHLMDCREAISRNSRLMEDLQRQLSERNSLNKPRLEEGSSEREVVVQKLAECQRFDKSIRGELSRDFDINSSHQLGERIRALRKQYPDDFEGHAREIEKNRASQQQERQIVQQASGQERQSWQTQAKHLAPEKSALPDRGAVQESRDTIQELKQRVYAWANKIIEKQRKKFERVWEGRLPWRGRKLEGAQTQKRKKMSGSEDGSDTPVRERTIGAHFEGKTNLAGYTATEAGAANLESSVQQSQAVSLLKEYSKQSKEIDRLTGELNKPGAAPTAEQKGKIEADIASCKRVQVEITDRIKQDYDVTPRQLHKALKRQGVNFKNPPQQDEVMSQKNVHGTGEQWSQSLEKGAAALESVERSLQQLKIASTLSEDIRRNQEAVSEALDAAHRCMEQAIQQMAESRKLLTEVMGGKLPVSQGGEILKSGIAGVYGTTNINESRENLQQNRNREPAPSGRESQSQRGNDSDWLRKMYEGGGPPDSEMRPKKGYMPT